MNRLKKLLFVPLVYHAAIFVAMLFLHFTKDINLNIAGTWLFDIVFGMVVTPMFYAVMGIVHAILHDAKVYDYIYYSLGFLGIIGVVRFIVYILVAGVNAQLMLIGGGVFFVSLLVFTLWECLFALTDRMMKKRPKRGRKQVKK